jgi:hypothetical protein
MDVFEKLAHANTTGNGVALSHADVELLYAVAGKALAKAEDKLNKWQGIIADHALAVARDERRAARADQG